MRRALNLNASRLSYRAKVMGDYMIYIRELAKYQMALHHNDDALETVEEVLQVQRKEPSDTHRRGARVHLRSFIS
jgi:hypothetical protein